MSTKEIAFEIFDRLNEEQLENFIAIFKDIFPSAEEVKKECSQEEKDAFLEEVDRIRKNRLKPVPKDFDCKKELYEYLDERYGV